MSDWPKHLTDRPDLLIELLAKCVHRLGGYVVLSGDEVPRGPFNLAHRPGALGGIELKLIDGNEELH